MSYSCPHTGIVPLRTRLGGCLSCGDDADADAAVARAREFPGMQGMDLAQEVSCTEPYPWRDSVWTLDRFEPAPAARF